ncbi:MAG: aldose 1-epimerase family protein [Firmicutes bacterium]|nr:aldose 1-epimerase family protein [Bacillota bacterium]
MTKKDLINYTGTMQQLAYVREYVVCEGRANGLRMVEVKNGPLRFQAMADKCLDISALEFAGINISFTSKPGLNGRNPFDTHGEEALRSIMGGLFFTCGLQNICGPCETDGVEYPMHGRIRTTPAEHLCADAFWEDGKYILQVTGEMRESHLFGTNLVLRRTIRTVFGSNEIEITDVVDNQSDEAADLMLMYHCNFGYPFLAPGTRLVLPTKKVTGREDWSQAHIDCWQTASEPRAGETEYVYLHELASDEDGKSFAVIVNDDLNLGIRLGFDRKNQPYFMEWMSMKTGDYVIGLEPSNSSVYGRKYHEAQGTMHKIAPHSEEVFKLTFTVLQGEEIARAQKECEALKNNQKETEL